MKALALAPALALAAFALVAPPLAEAGHRHYNGCGHRQYSHGRGYRAPSYGYSHRSYRPTPYYGGGHSGGYGYGSRYYPSYGYGYYGSGYGYGYAPQPAYGYGYYGGDYGYGYGYAPPPPRYCRPRPRAHVGIYLGF